MDKNLVGLIGAVTSLAAVPPHAATAAPLAVEAVMRVESYADLLKPIPNAVELLGASEAARAGVAAPGSADDAAVQDAQFFYHHHHHHHRHYVPPYYRRPFYPPGFYPPAYYPRYHHHHHHHHHYYRGRGEY